MSTAAARALKERQKNRTLPSVEVPLVNEDELARMLRSVQEHLRMYEGDSGAPKERFVTIAELENAGLVKSDIKGRFAFISQVLGKDVAQMAGSTANPTQKDVVATDTSRTSRTPDGGGTTEGSLPTTAKLNDLQDVSVANPAQREFLMYNGNKFTNYALFKQNIIWRGQQLFELPVKMREQAAGPEVVEGLGYLWIKADTPNTPWFTNDAGEEQLLDPGISTVDEENGSYTFVLADKGRTKRKASGASGETYTIPANSAVAFKIGTMIGVENDGGGTLTIAITTDTLTSSADNTTGSRTLADGGSAVIKKVTATGWKIAGNQMT